MRKRTGKCAGNCIGKSLRVSTHVTRQRYQGCSGYQGVAGNSRARGNWLNRISDFRGSTKRSGNFSMLLGLPFDGWASPGLGLRSRSRCATWITERWRDFPLRSTIRASGRRPPGRFLTEAFKFHGLALSIQCELGYSPIRPKRK